MENEIWVGTFREVVAYTKEREKMKELMLDADKRNNLAQAAIITSKRYSVESIVDSWNKLFAKL